jgi:hypothetical protein
MNHRTRGIVIALASAAAGGLLPAAVQAEMASTHFMAMGLAIVVVLNAVIAVIHIKDPETGRSDEDKAVADRPKPQTIRAVSSTDVKREGAA